MGGTLHCDASGQVYLVNHTGEYRLISTMPSVANRANLRVRFDPGDYETVGNGVVEGRCAGCEDAVEAVDASVIRYHPHHPGGIFHQRCQPTGPGWYGVEDQGEGAEDL